MRYFYNSEGLLETEGDYALSQLNILENMTELSEVWYQQCTKISQVNLCRFLIMDRIVFESSNWILLVTALFDREQCARCELVLCFLSVTMFVRLVSLDLLTLVCFHA